MIATGDTCGRAATIVALLALLWAVGVLWVLGTLYEDLDDVERDEIVEQRQRAERFERILAALREPIARKMLDRDGIDEASDEQWREAMDDVNRAIRAAVTAAEQEVGRE